MSKAPRKPRKTPMSVTAQRLLVALGRGDIIATGAIVLDCNCKPLMNTTDLYMAIQELRNHGKVVERLDSATVPAWRLLK